MAIVRIVGGVLAGVALAFGVVFAGDWLNHQLFPPPADLNVRDPESLRAYVASAPLASLVGLPLTWTIAGAVGAFAGARIAGRVWAGWIAGAALFAATLANLALIPHPWWMLAAAVVFVPLACWFAARWGAPAQ